MAIPLNLPKICACIGHSNANQAAALALASCDHGEEFLELRIDALADPSGGPRIIKRILRRHPDVTVLATCRRKASGGSFAGAISQQLAVLREALAAGAGIVDIEIETIDQAPDALDPFRASCTTLASYHNFEKTPALGPVMRRLERTGADILKVATRVNRPSDNLKLLALCKDRTNVVVAGMGETGSVARLISPQRGGLFTYAAPDSYAWPVGKRRTSLRAEPTAPGQVSAVTARDLYRVQRGSSSTKIYAVIANPVGHSMSPLIHNRAFKARRFDGIYVPLLLEPTHMGDFFRTLRELPLQGASVTIPHKQRVIRHLDSLDQAARGIGAVNTLYWKRGRLCGTNTDAEGIVKPLSARVKLNRSRVLVVGNGGAAKAAIVALKQQGSQVTVTGRNAGRARRLARLHGVDSLAFDRLADTHFDVLVQATPVGMLPNTEANLFPGDIPADVVFDLVYNPLETTLLKHAAATGRVVISGIEMFVEQAAAQFQIWTGQDAPREVMRNAVLERTVK